MEHAQNCNIINTLSHLVRYHDGSWAVSIGRASLTDHHVALVAPHGAQVLRNTLSIVLLYGDAMSSHALLIALFIQVSES